MTLRSNVLGWKRFPGSRPPWPGRTRVRPRGRGPLPGRRSRADPVPDRPARLLLRRGRRAAAVRDGRLLDHPARCSARSRTGSRSSWLMPVGVALAAVGIAGSRAGAELRAHRRRGRHRRPRRRRLPPRGRALRQLRVRLAPRHRHEPLQRRRQRGLRARPDPDHARGAAVRPVRDAGRRGPAAADRASRWPSSCRSCKRAHAPPRPRAPPACRHADRSEDDWGAFGTLDRGRLGALRRSTSGCSRSRRSGSSTTTGRARRRQRGAGRDAGRGRARDARRRAAGGPDRPPRGAASARSSPRSRCCSAFMLAPERHRRRRSCWPRSAS